MKIMKRITVAIIGIIMVLSLVACSQSEKTVVLRGDLTDKMSGVSTTDTWTLTTKGDTVQTLKEAFEMELSEYDDVIKESVISSLETSILEPAKDIEGVECTAQMKGDTYIMELTIDCKGDAVKEAVDAGILQIVGSTSRISLKRTQSLLEEQGYEVVE